MEPDAALRPDGDVDLGEQPLEEHEGGFLADPASALGARGDDRVGAGRRRARASRAEVARAKTRRGAHRDRSSPASTITNSMESGRSSGSGSKPGMDAHAEAADLRIRQPRQGLASRSGVTPEVHRAERTGPTHGEGEARIRTMEWSDAQDGRVQWSPPHVDSTLREKRENRGRIKVTPAQGAVQVSPGDFPLARAAFAASVTRPSIRSTGTVA